MNANVPPHEREASLLMESAATQIEDLQVLSRGSHLVAKYSRRGVPCVMVADEAGPPEHYARIGGALRSPIILAATGSTPGWFAGHDAALAQWSNSNPAWIVSLPWTHRGAPLAWTLQVRPSGASSVVALAAGDDGSFGLAAFERALRTMAHMVPSSAQHPEQRFLDEPRHHASALRFISPAQVTSTHGFVGHGGMSPADARATQEALLARISTRPGSPEAAINAAAVLLSSGRYEEAIAAYVDVGRAFPERAGTAASQIGAAQYFLGRYEQAIASYRHALDLGEDPDMMRENIVEAEEALRKRGGFR